MLTDAEMSTVPFGSVRAVLKIADVWHAKNGNAPMIPTQFKARMLHRGLLVIARSATHMLARDRLMQQSDSQRRQLPTAGANQAPPGTRR